MKVRAIKKGFYDKIRLPGDEFDIKDKKALGSWMKEIKKKKPVEIEHGKDEAEIT